MTQALVVRLGQTLYRQKRHLCHACIKQHGDLSVPICATYFAPSSHAVPMNSEFRLHACWLLALPPSCSLDLLKEFALFPPLFSPHFFCPLPSFILRVPPRLLFCYMPVSSQLLRSFVWLSPSLVELPFPGISHYGAMRTALPFFLSLHPLTASSAGNPVSRERGTADVALNSDQNSLQEMDVLNCSCGNLAKQVLLFRR